MIKSNNKNSKQKKKNYSPRIFCLEKHNDFAPKNKNKLLFFLMFFLFFKNDVKTFYFFETAKKRLKSFHDFLELNRKMVDVEISPSC